MFTLSSAPPALPPPGIETTFLWAPVFWAHSGTPREIRGGLRLPAPRSLPLQRRPRIHPRRPPCRDTARKQTYRKEHGGSRAQRDRIARRNPEQ